MRVTLQLPETMPVSLKTMSLRFAVLFCPLPVGKIWAEPENVPAVPSPTPTPIAAVKPTAAPHSSTPTLFLAALRPDPGAPDSTGYGTATLLLSPDETHARVIVSYSNLTSTPVSGHLKLGAPGEDGA